MNEMTMPRQDFGADSGVGFDVYRVREDFPILSRKIYDKPLVYLDSAASAQKPRVVIDTMRMVMEQEYANVHRGVHWLSAQATRRFEDARRMVQRFINAREDREIVFTRSATEAINLVAASWGRTNLREGDEIVLSQMEHHANIVPWQMLRAEKGIVIKVVPINDDGELILEEYEKLLGPKVKLVAISHMSNALGTINPVEDIIRLAHAKGITVLIDGCQGVTHLGVDVQALDADFYVFSGHKLYGPTGIGVLYGREARLEAMPPFLGGGDMIASVSFERSTWNVLPYKFEAGTPHMAGAVGLHAALDYIDSIGFERIAAHEAQLLAHATDALAAVPGIRLIGTARRKGSIVSFVMDGVHPHDIGTIVDREGVAIRTGHHCAQPVMERFGVPATARASLAMYNTPAEIDALVRALWKVRQVFA
jgi:cysteine desulfurase/selenocysteine lyase